MTLCTNCGKEFKIHGFKKFINNQTICPDCHDDKDKKIQRYLDAVNYFGKDNYLSKEEEAALQELKLNLCLSDDDVKKGNKKIENLRDSTVKANIVACDQKIAAISSDGVITPEEENELAELMNTLGMTNEDLPDKTQQNLFDVRMLTNISKGLFPNLQVNILLKANEICHFATPVQLMEELTKTRYVGGSSGVSFRVAKGVTLRSGSFRGQAVKESYKKVTDGGTLYVTNKKVLFVGAGKNVSYPMSKIINITKYTDGIKFEKENETKSRVFLTNRRSHIDAIGLIVSMLAQNS